MENRTMDKERLQALQRTLVWLRDLPELPEGFRFSMGCWRSETPKCGTHLCLAGWYVEKNPACGLEFALDDCDGFFIQPVGYTYAQMKETRRGQILAEHFGLKRWMAQELFHSEYYPCVSDAGRQQFAAWAAERINWLLENTLAQDDPEFEAGWYRLREEQVQAFLRLLRPTPVGAA